MVDNVLNEKLFSKSETEVQRFTTQTADFDLQILLNQLHECQTAYRSDARRLISKNRRNFDNTQFLNSLQLKQIEPQNFENPPLEYDF